LRKETDIERVAVERISAGLPAPQVDQIHDVMEGEETDPERKRNLQMAQRRAGDGLDIVEEEIGVFEEPEHRQIADDRRGDDRGSLRLGEPTGGEPIDQD